jgi:hypothetical protein
MGFGEGVYARNDAEFLKTADKSIWAKSTDPTVPIGKAGGKVYFSNLYQNGKNAGKRGLFRGSMTASRRLPILVTESRPSRPVG